MNIIEALKTGKTIRRPDSLYDWTRHRGDERSVISMFIEDMLATDYLVVQEPDLQKLHLSKKEIEEAFVKVVGNTENNTEWSFISLRKALLKELGFRE